jgi:hypothetical protein
LKEGAMFGGHEHVEALWEALSDRFVFPRERLRRALEQFEAARLYETQWPLSLRILAEGIRLDAVACDGLLPGEIGDIDRLLSRLTQFAAACWHLGPEVPATASTIRRKQV